MNTNYEIKEENEFIDDFDCDFTDIQPDEPKLSSDDRNLLKFLEEKDIACVYPYLKQSQITFKSLEYLTEEDIQEAIKPIGIRAMFRAKLIEWRTQKFHVQELAPRIQPNIISSVPQATGTSVVKSRTVLNKDLKMLLEESTKGRNIIEYYRSNQSLTNFQRYGIIDTIIEEVLFTNTILKAQDFDEIFNEICEIFPNESNLKDFYYIPRMSKNNASGKLYSKYKTKSCKKRKLMSSSNTNDTSLKPNSTDSSVTPISTDSVRQVDTDSSTAAAYRTDLNRDGEDWDNTIENWRRTCRLRQKDLKAMGSSEFISTWKKLYHPKSPELINIDFHYIYPLRVNFLLEKWNDFKESIVKYYTDHIHNSLCQQLFKSALSATNIDAQDYIYTILLNAVLPSSTRLKGSSGRRNKKVTLIEAQESLVLLLPSLKDHQRKIKEIMNKYYSDEQHLQPFIIVVGLTPDNVTGFYISLNNKLLKMGSFLESLDTCFKIFQVLSLEYPPACEDVWLFLQSYFFEINTKFDKKSANVTSLVNFLKTNR